jgi:hypothetical protein
MKEVAGGAACLVDPLSVTSIREGVLKVTGDQAYRQQLVLLGQHNVQRYDVVTISQQSLSCYRELQEGKPGPI